MTWTLDGINLSNLAWNIKSRSSGWNVPGKSGSNVKVPNRHGAFWTPHKVFDQGDLTLSMWVMGCNQDGTIPADMDSRKQVLENLDQLTALFGTTNRLLTLRKQTGSDIPLINELSNPTLLGTGSSGTVLATNAIANPDILDTTTQVVSRNLSKNPFLKGRSTTAYLTHEDLYPDAGLLRNKNKDKSNQLRGYFYPINQNVTTHYTRPRIQ